jgi:hypothetical protein
VTNTEGKPELDKKGRPQTRILTAQPPVRAAIRKVADAIGGQTPVLVVSRTVQLHCRINKIGVERYDLNMCVTVTR